MARKISLLLVLVLGISPCVASLAAPPTDTSRQPELSAVDSEGNEGWENSTQADDDWGDDEDTGSQWYGFVELAAGARPDRDDRVGRSGTLAEARLRVEREWQRQGSLLSFKAEALYDGLDGGLDATVRELALSTSRGSIDLKVGRQVLTWGTGDLVFLNDLFPKDWVSFFAGRDDEYLKAPSDTVRTGWYGSTAGLELAWTPAFEADTYLNGNRFSFFSPLAGDLVAPHPPLAGSDPSRTTANGEFALRAFGSADGSEYAFYAYRGFFKMPTDLRNPDRPTFAPMHALGASVRGTVGDGLWNGEVVHYFSRDDPDGDDPLVPNDQLRLLLGHEQEWVTRLTVGVQYLLDWTLDHDRMIDNSPTPAFEPEEHRHLLTSRVTWRSPMETLTLSLFAFVSPSDRDGNLRPSISWRYSDRWSFAAGANIFAGSSRHSFFGQFRDADNAWLRARCNFGG
jgi:hypothetical protein